jgi:uncharacterized repeat protein (TIGR01451 family)
MGTKANPGARVKLRGLTTFVAFLLLFAFAIGQSSLIALADDAGTDPVAEEAASDGGGEASLAASAPEEAPAEEAPAEEAPVAEEAPAEEPAEEAPPADGGADNAASSDGGTASMSSDDSGLSTRSKERSDRNVALAAPASVGILQVDTPGAPSGDGVQPVLLMGNQNCAQVLGDALLFEYRDNSPGDDTVDLAAVSGGLVEGTLEIDVHGSLVDFTIEDGDPVAAVIVKGGSNANLFDYRPGGNLADTNLHSPVNPNNGQFYGLSHFSFCWTVEPKVPGIDVEKTCPAEVPFGEDIEYTITLENTGNEPLENVVVTDALLGGDITAAFNLPDPLPVGDTVYSAEFAYSPGAGEDPVENSVTASGDGVDSGVTDEDTAQCTTDVTHEPGIDVEKTCDAFAHLGDTITYSITVTNTGNEALTNVTVDDTVLGDLSEAFADDLGVGESETQQFEHVVGSGDADPLVNVVTAAGSGVDTETSVEDIAQCQTDVLNPAIDIVKTVDEETVPVGTTVTYTYVITNTGDTTLFDVSVDDDILGHIGDIPVLEPGQSVTMTKDFVVGEDPVTNVATAEGEDVLGRSVSASDDAVVTPILAENPSEPTPPPTPFTGSDAARLGIIAMGLFGLGAALVATTWRRRVRGSV